MKQAMKQSRYTVIFWLVCIKKGRRFTLPLLYINAYYIIYHQALMVLLQLCLVAYVQAS